MNQMVPKQRKTTEDPRAHLVHVDWLAAGGRHIVGLQGIWCDGVLRASVGPGRLEPGLACLIDRFAGDADGRVSGVTHPARLTQYNALGADSDPPSGVCAVCMEQVLKGCLHCDAVRV